MTSLRFAKKFFFPFGIKRIHAPLLHRTKAEIIRTGIEAGVDISLTHSCYDPSPQGLACGACGSCILRRHEFPGLSS